MLFQSIKKTISISHLSISNNQKLLLFLHNLSTPTSFCTVSTNSNDNNGNNNGCPNDSISYRVEKLKRGEPVVSAFQSWMGEGFAIHRGDIFHAINRLRKLKKNKRALEVMEWVMRERPYKIKELDYSYLLEFTIKLHGVSNGESLFLRIPHKHQNELLYNNLVIACLDQGKIRLTLDYMKKMRELSFPISYHVYNRLIELHSCSSRKHTIPKILIQMKAEKICPHVSTYNILLHNEASNHNIKGLSKVFNDMKRSNVEPNEITYGVFAKAHAVARLYVVAEMYTEAIEQSKTGTNWSTYDVLLILYGYLCKENELERTWKMVEDLPHVRSKSFVLAIEAFGKLGSLSRVGEIWMEMKSRKEINLPQHSNAIISAYCRHGCLDKASEIYKEMEMNGCKPNSITYRHLALGCLKAGLVDEALKTIDLGKDEALSFQVRRSTLWLETTHMLMECFADIGDLQKVKRLFEEFKETRYHRYAFVYNTYIRAHVKARVYDPELLRRMILREAAPDADTYSLVRLLELFKK